MLKSLSKWKPTSLEKCFEYQVEHDNRSFVVRVRDAHFGSEGKILADVNLGMLMGKGEIKVWKPKLTNPLYFEAHETYESCPLINLNNLHINPTSLTELFLQVYYRVKREDGKEMSQADIEVIFGKVYEHYRGLK